VGEKEREKRRLKVVLDTNILVSALGWRGNPHKILERVVNGEIELYACKEQLLELSRVLEYPKFAFSYEQKARFKEFISRVALLVEITGKLDIVVKDPSDNFIAECALVSGADLLVTGDPHLLSIKNIGKVRIT